MENRPPPVAVHVEGVDGSGKTTLAAWLAERTGRPLLPTEGPAASWADCVARVARRVVPGVVADRSSGLISELVYGPVLRGNTVVPEEQFWHFVRAVAPGVVWVYCRVPESRVAHVPRPGEDPDLVKSVNANRRRLARRYDEVMVRLGYERARVVRFDWTRDDRESLVTTLEQYGA